MLKYLLFAVGVSVLWGLSITPAIAASSSLVISHIQTGGAGSGTSGQEFVAVYNNSPTSVDITGWCLKYSDYTNVSISELYCFQKSPDMDAVLLPRHSSAVIVSQSYPVQDVQLVTGSYKNASTAMSGTRGHVTLYDHINNIIDRVAWDNGASAPPNNPETKAALAPIGGNMIVRELDSNMYIDTDDNYEDFVSVSSQRPIVSSLIDYKEPPAVVDQCGNIDGLQLAVPDGFGLDEVGDCYDLANDLCANIPLVQINTPDQMIAHSDGNCYHSSADACENLDGFQLDMPSNYRRAGSLCKIVIGQKNIQITELLANSLGVDTGNEFIELYNADVVDVDLSDYELFVGKSAEKQLSLPQLMIRPGEYISFTDTELGFTLLNTTTRVELHYYDGSLQNEIIPYQDPNDEIAWALIDGVWQYTNTPTPGLANIGSAEEVLSEQVSENANVLPCPSGKYRNPLTNRCRNIEEDASVLAACDADEYRSPDTNRCRKITLASAIVTPCNEGYERNPETNRCRKVTNEEEKLSPCAEGSERNPLTNRCKKIVESTLSSVASAGKEQQANNISGIALNNPYMIAATVGVGATGYGIYEWRTELGAIVRRILGVFSKK